MTSGRLFGETDVSLITNKLHEQTEQNNKDVVSVSFTGLSLLDSNSCRFKEYKLPHLLPVSFFHWPSVSCDFIRELWPLSEISLDKCYFCLRVKFWSTIDLQNSYRWKCHKCLLTHTGSVSSSSPALSCLSPQWLGAPSCQRGSYAFYKSVSSKAQPDGPVQVWKLGEFYFIRCGPEDPVCIAEVRYLVSFTLKPL